MEATEAELQAWGKARPAIFKMPVAIRFVQETLPRNANGGALKVLFEDRVGVAAWGVSLRALCHSRRNANIQNCLFQVRNFTR